MKKIFTAVAVLILSVMTSCGSGSFSHSPKFITELKADFNKGMFYSQSLGRWNINIYVTGER